MEEKLHDNKRIAKNTIVLYGRMLVMMFIGLFTSRVVLNALGVEDYGINNVVGGFLGLFAIVTQSMSSTISRYVTFELGRNNAKDANKVFCTSVNIQVLYALVIVLLAETIGLWFLNTKLVIPETRLFAANVVYQLAVVSMVINLISVPYDACIVAHERMSAFAYITLYDAVAKLVIAYLLYLHIMDNLIFMALLNTGVAWSQRAIYLKYCKKNFAECNYHLIFDKGLLKRMFGFAGWNLIGSSSAVLRDQGGTVLLNMFFGPAVNAAQGIAAQINGKVMAFAGSFMTAMNPQITKSYASGDMDYLYKLIYKGSRFSFCLMLFFALPVWLNTHFVLKVWLGIVPDHTVWFARLMMCFVMLEALSNTIVIAVKATEKIKKYQIVVGGLQMLNLPLTYLAFKFGSPSEYQLIIAIFVGHVTLVARLFMTKKLLGLSPLLFFSKVYLKVLSVAAVAMIIPFAVTKSMEEGWICLIVSTSLSLLCVPVSAYFVGCGKDERMMLRGKLVSLYSKRIRK